MGNSQKSYVSNLPLISMWTVPTQGRSVDGVLAIVKTSNSVDM